MKTTTIAILALLALTLGSCQEKKPAEEKISATRYTPTQPQGPIAMPADIWPVRPDSESNMDM